MAAISFPANPSVNDIFTSNGRTWTWNGTFWSLTISVATSAIEDGSISSVKIADGAITAAKIADGTIVAAEIASNAVTTAKILDANITAAKIASSAVTEAKIGDGAVTQAKLGTTLSAVTVTTAANRDTAVASPFTGQLVFLTDTKKIQVWDGTSWLNITLAPPETPTSLSATALSTTSVSIAFTAGGANGSPITNYKYALSTNGGSTYGSFTALSPEDITTPITISGLTAATTYYIKLKAVNDMGDSVASAAVSISTLSTPEAPTSLSAGSITTTSAVISFTPGAQGGSAISNYQYALSTNSGSTYGSFTALSPADATSPITISGLTQNTAYYIKLKAVNGDGAGTESSAVSFTTAISVDYLVVGGGGSGGGGFTGGGGGAGGLRSTVTATGGGGSLESALSLLIGTNYTVTIGAGGTGADDTSGTKGSSSFFSTVESFGGGGGGKNQGSGGGGGGNNGSDGNTGGGAGGVNQGFAGRTSANLPLSDTRAAGGGGGAGGLATAPVDGVSSTTASNGGVGVAVSITGSSVYYGGGGAGLNYDFEKPDDAAGTGGLGGGANSSLGINVDGQNGGANLGGGGSGGTTYSGWNAATKGGNGGSGVVILRYPNTRTITIGAGLTGSTTTVGANKVTTITAGSGNVSWT